MTNAADYRLSEYLEVCPVPEPGRHTGILAFSTRSGRFLQIQTEIWEKLRAGDYASLSSDTVDGLVESELLVPHSSNEHLMLSNASRSASSSVRTLTRMILPTSYCQLGCFYCGQEHAQKTMSSETMERLIEDVESSLRTGGFERLLVTWFGGEPTTAPEVIRSLSSRFLTICKELGIRYESRMITNGLALTQPLAAMLVKECRVTVFTISLDGPERIHDSRRATKTGKGTFARILGNIKDIAASGNPSDCAVHIRVNIDKENAPYVHEFIEILADHELAKRVNVDLAVVVPWSLHSNPEFIDRNDFAEMEIGWFGHLLSRGFRVTLLPTPRASACLAAEPSSAVVATDGNLHNCALTPLALHEITRTTRPLGHLKLKDPKAGLDRHNEIFRLISSKEIPCSSCKYLFLCQGACPKDIEKGLLNCPGFKFNLPARMALHYLMRKRLESPQAPELKFDFSRLRLEPQQESLFRNAILADINRFCSRFAMFRVPDQVVLHDVNSPIGFGIIEEEKGRVLWNHRIDVLQTDATVRTTSELAECYLAQINPHLSRLSHDPENVEVCSLATAFVGWVTTLIIDGYERTMHGGHQHMRSALNYLGRQFCMEHLMAQPVGRLLNVVKEISNSQPKDSVAVADPAFAVLSREVFN